MKLNEMADYEKNRVLSNRHIFHETRNLQI